MTRVTLGLSATLLLVAAAFGQDAGQAVISGRVVFGTAATPGALVTAVGGDAVSSVTTDGHGRFTLAGLVPGNYDITVRLAGLEIATRNVRLTPEGVNNLEFGLRLACLGASDPPLSVDNGFPLTLQHADAVVDVRISETSGAHRWDVDQGCVVAAEYVATVGDVAKWTRPEGLPPRKIRFLDIGPATEYSAGEEYVAVLFWQPSIARFQTLGGRAFMFPVRNGRVAWPRHDIPGLTDGMRVGEFLAALRLVVANVRGPSRVLPADDFAFRFDATSCAANTLDTRTQSYTRAIGSREPISVPLPLSSTQMAAVFQAIIDIGFFEYPTDFKGERGVGGGLGLGLETVTVSPSTSYRLAVRNAGVMHSVSWRDASTRSEEANRLLGLFHLIERFVDGYPGVKGLPTVGCK